MESIINEKYKKFVVLALVAISLFLILFRFTETPKVWLDEGVFSEVSKNYFWHGEQGLQTEPGKFFPMHALTTSGYPLTIPVGLSVSIFGNGIWQTRLPMVLYMLGLVLVYYLFTKKRYGFYTASLTVLALLSFAPFYGNGRSVQGELPGLFFLGLALLFLLYLEESMFLSKKWAIASGLALGLSASSKPIYLLVLLTISPVVVFLWYKKKQLMENNSNKSLYLIILGFLVPVLFLFFFQFPNKEALSTIVPVYKLLISNHESTVSIWETLFNNSKRFFTESTPILFLVLLVFVLANYLTSFVKNKYNSFYLAEFVVLGFIVVNWGAYLIGTGWYRYFFPAHALIYLLFISSVFAIRNRVENKNIRLGLSVFPMAIILLQFGHLIFLSDSSFTTQRTRNQELSSVISGIDNSKSIFFYNTVEGIIFLRGGNYSQYLQVGTSIDTGDKNYLLHPTTDYILTNLTETGFDLNLECYGREEVNRYYFFTKINDCKKKTK
ncbi:MAG: hypothetical protein AB198_00640 [Parcubacteria bacterium C7867-003]|nr:MAG: hypothetical protein AB198_00640 [Parcubacteria bacterium C7867-003]